MEKPQEDAASGIPPYCVIASHQLCPQAGTINRGGSKRALTKPLLSRTVSVQKSPILATRQIQNVNHFIGSSISQCHGRGRREERRFLD